MGCTASSPTAEVDGSGGQKINGAKHAATVGGGSRERREANGETQRRTKAGSIHIREIRSAHIIQ